jgi:carbonic anhydrase/acetyltransferase-like protein (isoleucine patch superfamily)
MKKPKIDKTSFVHEKAVVIGDVTIGKHASIWPGVVLRGDVNSIEIGDYSNIQDNSVVHVDFDISVKVGNYVTVGHSVTLHACTIGDGALIGMGSTLLDGVEVGEGAIIAAASLLVPRTKVPPRTLWRGSPARQVSGLNDEESQKGRKLAIEYAEKIVKLYE